MRTTLASGSSNAHQVAPPMFIQPNHFAGP